mmetsp:Transcript_35724/g.54151  ORF Transcript_35724/g.54151 Transcript_35724/m.54151 type:complete len:101 (+) Transcript_35724:520-822(+)
MAVQLLVVLFWLLFPPLVLSSEVSNGSSNTFFIAKMFNILLFCLYSPCNKIYILPPFSFIFWNIIKNTGAAGGSITHAAHKRHGKKKIQKLERKLAEGTY